jgi:prepilin-type N-terminal cleavage/methylation domain-containing protein
MKRKNYKYRGFTPIPICIVSANVKSNYTSDSVAFGLHRRCANRCGGFTLAELLMAVWVMSIILAAIATLSFALGSANDSVDNTSEIQSRIRYATMRLGGLIKNSKLICAKSGSSVAIWQADYDGDSQIDPNEIVYIDSGSSNNYIKLISFNPSGATASFPKTLGSIQGGQARTWLEANCQSSSITIIDNCSYVNFTTDQQPPFSKKLNIFFGVSNNGSIENYQISAYLRCQADYLLDGGQIDPNDDDI